MRKLIHIPNVHSEEDRLVDVADPALHGSEDLTDHVRTLKSFEDKVWSSIDRGISRLPDNLRGVKIFAEAMTKDELAVYEQFRGIVLTEPFETREKFARMLANPTNKEIRYLRDNGFRGRQARLILFLITNGAGVEITEGRNYTEIRKIFGETARFFKENPHLNHLPEELANRFNKTNRRREKDIARNINAKLKEGETGILILGMGHDLSELMARDIQVELIDSELADIKSEMHEWRDSHREIPKSPVGENMGVGEMKG